MKYMIDNARALLGQFLRSDWRELHVRTPDGEIFIARDGAGPNPMLRSAGPAAAADDAAQLVVVTPHVADVAWLLPVGSTVAPETVVARLDLLGEVVEVQAGDAGTVTGWRVAAGDFVEYGAPLLAIARAS